MRIQATNNSINFQKTLKANCKVLDENRKPCECKIYEIDPYKDRNYFENLLSKKSWQNAEYLSFIDHDMQYQHETPNSHIYVLENKKSHCLGYAIATDGNAHYSIDLLEIAPRYKNDTEGVKGKYKYVGETLVAFLTKKAIKKQKKVIDVDAAHTATGFYEQACGFDFYDPDYDEMYLDESNYQNLIQKNEKHTKGTINLIS